MLDGEKRERDQICTWENYDWKLPKPKEVNRYLGTGRTENPKQDEPKRPTLRHCNDFIMGNAIWIWCSWTYKKWNNCCLCENKSWTVKKVEHWRIDAFELWCWRRLLRVPWTARRSNHKGDQSWVFIGRTDAKAETPILWPRYVKSWLTGKDWCWEGLGAGGEGDDRGWDAIQPS